MSDDDGFFKSKAVRLYPEENAIGFVFVSEEWAQKFYFEALLRGRKYVRLKGNEVILQTAVL